MKNFIGQEIYSQISHYEKSKITELRFREGKPLQMEYGGEMIFSKSPIGKEIIVEKSDIKKIVLSFCDGTLFTKEKQIGEGFLTKDGARLGICGECDMLSGELKSTENITSLALRLPFCGELLGSCEAKFIARSMQSTLVIAPFGAGKTTFLKRVLASFPQNKKIFLCDDRGEFGGFFENLENVDCMKNAKKNKAFEIAIRTFSPHALMIDEMFYSLDSELLKKAQLAGISIFASFHGRSLDDYINSELYSRGLFYHFVVLGEKRGKGSVEGVYLENGTRVYIKEKEEGGNEWE